ncbi:hypothetical protein BDR07DRAFT_1375585 [Suillus spraguei]|nr:hypothetical protein BDR07DRAFT_1375585 [Suillus spraguei]
MDMEDCGETTFAVGASDGNIQVYEQINNALFEFQSITTSYTSAVESLAWDPVHCRLVSASYGHLHVWSFNLDKTLKAITSQPGKQLYITRTVHFYDNGASLLVLYLESGEMLVYYSILDLPDPSLDSATLLNPGA